MTPSRNDYFAAQELACSFFLSTLQPAARCLSVLLEGPVVVAICAALQADHRRIGTPYRVSSFFCSNTQWFGEKTHCLMLATSVWASPGSGDTVSVLILGGAALVTLEHPRWLYVLPSGDVLVAESNAPPKPKDSKGIKAAIDEISADREKPMVVHQVKYLNNIVEQDHCAVKRVTRPMLGFKSFLSEKNFLAGIELMHMIRKGQLMMVGCSERSFADQFYALAGQFRPA
jgi:hypothetical protein